MILPSMALMAALTGGYVPPTFNTSTTCPDGTVLLGGGSCPAPGAPAALPAVGAAVAWQQARRLRRRMRGER